MPEKKRSIVSTLPVWLTGLLLLVAGCSGPDSPFSSEEVDERYGAGQVGVTPVTEPVSFTSENYDFTGELPIEDLYGLIPSDAFVFYGLSTIDPWPVQDGPCGLGGRQGNTVTTIDELPATIEGIVTLHPRYFQKTTFCGSDERYYGSYFLQDSSGGILILKDSRIADFTYGDRVRLRVRGVMKFFDIRAVTVWDEEEVVSRGHDVYYRETEEEFSAADIGEVLRVTGEVFSEATNDNFNEMCLVHPDNTSDEPCAKVCELGADCESGQCLKDDPQAREGICKRTSPYWFVSIDRELGQRQPVKMNKGDLVQVTAPVIDSFSLRMIVMKLGQLDFPEN